MSDISNTADIIDVRDIIERFEELEKLRESAMVGTEDERLDDTIISATDEEELAQLTGLLSKLAGYGGDEQWRGDWYPVTLISDDYFEEYAQELASDIGDYNAADNHWPYTCIDWKQAASELQMDYSSVDYDGKEYWYR